MFSASQQDKDLCNWIAAGGADIWLLWPFFVIIEWSSFLAVTLHKLSISLKKYANAKEFEFHSEIWDQMNWQVKFESHLGFFVDNMQGYLK